MELGLLALGAGVVIGVLAFLPYVAISYRRHGRLTARRFVLAFALLVYFLAIWTYTLLPLPDPDEIRCTSPQLDPTVLVRDLSTAVASGHPLTNPAFLQIALNILLFLPLGFFVRLIWRRGWVTATLVGSILSLAIPLRLRGRWGEAEDAGMPRPVTVARRLVAMTCDVLSVVLTSIAISVVLAVIDVVTTGGTVSTAAAFWYDLVGNTVPFVVTLTYMLVAGRTIGHAAVQLRYTGSRMPVPVARLLRFLGGIGGWQLIGLLPGDGGIAQPLFLLVSVVLIFVTKDHRGLPGFVSGQRLVDSRATANESVPA